MKKIYPFVMAFLCLLTISNAQTGSWTLLTSGTTTSLLGVSAPDLNTVFVSGFGGTIRKSSNAGLTWTPQTSGTSLDLYSICFTDANNGFAVGSGGAAKRTNNSGTTWTSISVAAYDYRCVYFYDSNIGFITGGSVGSPGVIYKTTNGGISWSLLTTTGASTNVIYSIFFTSATVGYAVDYDQNMMKTTDGGITWNSVSGGTSSAMTGSIKFTSATNGFACSNSGKISTTTTSGASWSGTLTGGSDPLTGLDFASSTTGFAVGGNVSANTGSIATTTDGGLTWSTSNPGTPRLYRVDMVTVNLGYICGLGGTIMKYTNTVGITENVNMRVSFNSYPNPFSESTTIDCSSIDFTNDPSVKIYDVTGKIVRDFTSADKNRIIIEKGELNSGMYFYKVLDGNKMVGTGKMIVK